MSIIRTTAKYRAALHLPEELPERPGRNGSLGEWYANTLSIGHLRYLHYMSSRSLLSVIIWLREAKTAEGRMFLALEELLQALGVSAEAVARELSAMVRLFYARSNSRSILASMRDQA